MAVVALVIGVAVFPLAALAQISPPGNPLHKLPARESLNAGAAGTGAFADRV